MTRVLCDPRALSLSRSLPKIHEIVCGWLEAPRHTDTETHSHAYLCLTLLVTSRACSWHWQVMSKDNEKNMSLRKLFK
jgi:hypothetical protein